MNESRQNAQTTRSCLYFTTSIISSSRRVELSFIMNLLCCCYDFSWLISIEVFALFYQAFTSEESNIIEVRDKKSDFCDWDFLNSSLQINLVQASSLEFVKYHFFNMTFNSSFDCTIGQIKSIDDDCKEDIISSWSMLRSAKSSITQSRQR